MWESGFDIHILIQKQFKVLHNVLLHLVSFDSVLCRLLYQIPLRIKALFILSVEITEKHRDEYHMNLKLIPKQCILI